MFIEPQNFHEQNRQDAAEIKISDAGIADGTLGVRINFARFFAILTRDEAISIATKIVKQLDNQENR